MLLKGCSNGLYNLLSIKGIIIIIIIIILKEWANKFFFTCKCKCNMYPVEKHVCHIYFVSILSDSSAQCFKLYTLTELWYDHWGKKEPIKGAYFSPMIIMRWNLNKTIYTPPGVSESKVVGFEVTLTLLKGCSNGLYNLLSIKLLNLKWWLLLLLF